MRIKVLMVCVLAAALLGPAGNLGATSYVFQDLGTLGGNYSFASGINNSGQVAGHSEPSSGAVLHAFRYTGGVMTDLGTLGGGSSQASGINDSGQIVGQSDGHAFRYAGGVMTDLGTLGGGYSYAVGINNLGQIVGTSDGHAFLYDGGLMVDLSPLMGGTESSAWGINDNGQIVGLYRDALSNGHAFLLTPVPVPGALLLLGSGLLGLGLTRGRWSSRRKG